MARRESRLAKIGAAKAELEAEAKQKAEEKQAAAEAQIRQRQEQEARTGKKVCGREPQVPDPEQAVPDPKAQPTQLHRPGKPDPARWGPQGQLRARLQSADRGGWGSAGDRGGGGNAAEQRQAAIDAPVGAGEAECRGPAPTP